MLDIPKVNTLSDLKSHIARAIPCIYTLPKDIHTDAKQVNTKDYYIREYGNIPVTVRTSPSKHYIHPEEPFWFWVKSQMNTTMSLARFIEYALPQGMIISGTDTYLYDRGKTNTQWTDLWEKVQRLIPWTHKVDDPFHPSYMTTVGFWLSGMGIKSILHYDTSKDHNLNFQLAGQKKFLLFPPQDWKYLNTFLAMGLHPFEWYEHLEKSTPHTSTSQLHPYQAYVKKGEALFIPSQWYHYVEHQGDFNINMTYWFKPILHHTVSESTNHTINGKVIKDKPRQSSRDFILITRLLCSFCVAMILTLLNRVTATKIGHLVCDYQVNSIKKVVKQNKKSHDK